MERILIEEKVVEYESRNNNVLRLNPFSWTAHEKRVNDDTIRCSQLVGGWCVFV